jgi:hypothetical protein
MCNAIKDIRIENLETALYGKTTLPAIIAIIAMIDTVMNYRAGNSYAKHRCCIDIDDIDLHTGIITIGWGGKETSEGFYAKYNVETQKLSYYSWGGREKDNFEGEIESPWQEYLTIIQGVARDIQTHARQKRGTFYSEYLNCY